MTDAPALPLRIVPHSEAIEIRDARGRSIWLYFADDAARAHAAARWSREEAIDLAKQIARALSG